MAADDIYSASVDELLNDFDHQSEAFAHRWTEIYGAARAAGCPVVHSPHHGGFDVLTRHADVSAAFRDWKSFASERLVDEDGFEMDGGVGMPPHPFRIGFLEMDPPESLELRRLCNRWFTKQTIEACRPRLQEVMTWAFENVVELGACDIVTDIASPFQCVTIMDLLGIPLEKWKAYKAVVDTEVSQEEGNLDGLQWLLADIFDEIERQLEEGGHGLLAELITAEVDGEVLDPELVTELILMLLLGGMDTTIATVSHAARHLHEFPHDRARLIAEPDLIPAFIEEVLRFYCPATGMGRTVREPVEFAGKQFERGDRVYLAIASANRDEEAFERADEFILDRADNNHLAFGTGTHRCIGLDFGRANAQLFTEELLRWLPDFSVDVDAAAITPSIPHAHGYMTLPIWFTPADRTAAGRDSWPAFSVPPIRPVE